LNRESKKERRVKVIYLDCPRCSYRHGPITKDNAQGIVGCPQETGSYSKDPISYKPIYTPHRYAPEEMFKIRDQLNELN
jgi:hypothetical protein